MVEIADSPAAFEAAVERALSIEAAQPEAARIRRKFAMCNTWGHRYETLHRAIVQHIFPKVSIVIVTHNNWSFTRQCLNSLLRKDAYPNMEIIVVDNGSTDQTRVQLAALAQKPVQTVFSPINLGFAEGNSLGASCATGEYLILLNNDTIFPDSTWVPKLIRPMQEHSDIAMTGPMSNHVGNDQALDFLSVTPYRERIPAGCGSFMKITADTPAKPDCSDFSVWPSGAAHLKRSGRWTVITASVCLKTTITVNGSSKRVTGW